MNPATSVVVTGVLVTAGKWANDEPISIRIAVGGTILAIGLSILNETAPDLAGKFGLLVMLAAAFTYGPAVAYKLGLIKSAPPKWI